MTIEIYRWLKELGNVDAAKFLKDNCKIHFNFIDLAWDSNDRETVIGYVDITVPIKIHKELNLYQQYIRDIEQCIADYNQANGMYANSMEWTPVLSNANNTHVLATNNLKENVNEDYIVGQIDLMNESLDNNPHISLGIAKELIETFGKAILKAYNIEYDRNWDLPKLTKEVNKLLFSSDVIDLKAQRSLQIIISGSTTIIQGVTELRNSYGSGHGHEGNFKQLNIHYVRFVVSVTSEILLLWRKLADENIAKIFQGIYIVELAGFQQREK